MIEGAFSALSGIDSNTKNTGEPNLVPEFLQANTKSFSKPILKAGCTIRVFPPELTESRCSLEDAPGLSDLMPDDSEESPTGYLEAVVLAVMPDMPAPMMPTSKGVWLVDCLVMCLAF